MNVTRPVDLWSGIARCRVKDCFNNSGNYSGGIFKFPKDRDLAQLWARLCKLEHVFENTRNYRSIKICGAHFEPQMFSSTNLRQRLLSNSYPTLFSSTESQTVSCTKSDTALKLRNLKLQSGKKSLQILGRTEFNNLLIGLSQENVEQVKECSMFVDKHNLGSSIELAYDKTQEIKRSLALNSSNNYSAPILIKEIEKCRICLEQILQKGYYCMLDNKYFYQNQSIRQMLIYCIPNMKDTFADKDIICETCLKELEVCYNFIRKCYISMEKLSGIMKLQDLHAIVDVDDSNESINIFENVNTKNIPDVGLNKQTASIEILNNRYSIDSQDVAARFNDTDIDKLEPLDEPVCDNNTSNSKLRQLLLGIYPKDMLNKSLPSDTLRVQNTTDRRLSKIEDINVMNTDEDDDCIVVENKSIDESMPDDVVKLESSNIDHPKVSESGSLGAATENRIVQFQLIDFTGAIFDNSTEKATGQHLDMVNNANCIIPAHCPALMIDTKQETIEKSWTDLLKQDIAATHDYAKRSYVSSISIPISVSNKGILQQENKLVEHECGKADKTNSIHVKTCVNILRHQCSLCSAKFTSKKKLLFHLRVFHNNYKFYKCKKCSKGFEQLKNLNHHDCQRSRIFPCGSCDKIFDDIKGYRRHRQTAHYNFLCDLCGKAYRTRGLLFSHKLTHNESNNFQCEFCGRKFRYKTLLTSHRKIHTRTEKKFLCEICPKRFFRSNILRMHQKTHEDKKHKCHICNNMFSKPYSLSLHIKVMHDKIKNFQCNECLKCFSRKDYLTAHMHRHTGEPRQKRRRPKPLKDEARKRVNRAHPRRFKCNFCGLVFKTKVNLNKHSWFHLDGKNQFRCDICYKKFPRKEDVDLHCASTHQSNSKQHKCAQCTEEFARKFLLENHVLSVHERSKDYDNLSDFTLDNETCNDE